MSKVVVAGRSLQRAHEFAARLQQGARARITPARLDGVHVTAGDLATLRPLLVINASGPYQRQDYRLARACVAAGVHYLDLADCARIRDGHRHARGGGQAGRRAGGERRKHGAGDLGCHDRRA
jgi:short subunit dehydrogenase-like uncharacterized protein